MKQIKKQGISVIVCCYNSAAVLPATLQHLAQQQVAAAIPWEVIVVNNNSTDNTVQVAQHCWSQIDSTVFFRIVDQPLPGLSFAREKGFEAAQYEYMLLCDDDNWLQRDYVQQAYHLMTTNSTIGMLGGKGEAVFEDNGEPSWFELVPEQYATGAQAPSSGDISNTKRYVFGAGAVVRYTAYQYVVEKGFKSLLTDRKGKELSSGGDNELCYVLLLAGYKIWYDDKLRFKHFLTKQRLTWKYLERLNKAFANTAFYLRSYNYYFSKNNVFKGWIWLRDLRYLLLFLPKMTNQLLRLRKDSDAWKYQHIKIKSHLHLIAIYLKNRSVLDKNIHKVGSLLKKLRAEKVQTEVL